MGGKYNFNNVLTCTKRYHGDILNLITFFDCMLCFTTYVFAILADFVFNPSNLRIYFIYFIPLAVTDRHWPACADLLSDWPVIMTSQSTQRAALI